MRLLEAFDAANCPSLHQIDDIERSVAKLGHEQALALEIDRHVIDAARHIIERNRPVEHQRFSRPTACGSAKSKAPARKSFGASNTARIRRGSMTVDGVA